MKTKICTKCKRELPVEAFAKHNSTKDGLQFWCKECKRQRYQETREHTLKHQKEYAEKNKEKIRENGKIYREKNKEKKRQTDKAYRERNKDKIKAQLKEYYRTHIDERKAYKDKYDEISNVTGIKKDIKRLSVYNT